MEPDDLEFSSPSEVSSFMGCELSWTVSWKCPLYPGRRCFVFWSEDNDMLQSLHSQSLSSMSVDACSEDWTIKDEIKSLLGDIMKSSEECFLIQFWTPLKIGDGIFLTNATQPFGLTQKLHKGLCSYRKHFQDYLVSVDGLIAEEKQLGLLGRVFRRRLPEFNIDIRNYLPEEYPQHKYALDCGIRSCVAVPLLKSHQQQCIGVLEILSTSIFGYFWHQYHSISKRLKEMDLISWDLCVFCYDCASGTLKALWEIDAVMEVACETYQLPIAQTWLASSDAIYIQKIRSTIGDGFFGTNYDDDSCWLDNSVCYIHKGLGVVGKAFSSCNASFCKDISKLNINVYPLVPAARKLGLSGSFAICLQSSLTEGYIYVLEFFLPCKEVDHGDPRTPLSMLLATLKEKFKSFKVASGRKLGETLVVDIIRTSTDERDSFEICAATGTKSTPQVSALPEGRENFQLDSSYHQVDVVTSHAIPEVNEYLESRNGFAPLHIIGGTTGLDANEVIEFLPRSEISHNTGVREQDSSHQQSSMELAAPNKEVSIASQKQCDHANNNSRNEGPTITLDVEYGISREVLEQHSDKKLKDAAKTLGVSRSTLKRICRKHNILRWPPRKARKPNGSLTKEFLQPEKENIEASNVPNAGVQDNSSIIVKAKYRDDTIKFHLSPTSRMLDLEREVAMRLKLDCSGFKIKYLDEDNDWVLVACDADLANCMKMLRSLGQTTIKMLVS